jgi:hypothetical protein
MRAAGRGKISSVGHVCWSANGTSETSADHARAAARSEADQLRKSAEGRLIDGEQTSRTYVATSAQCHKPTYRGTCTTIAPATLLVVGLLYTWRGPHAGEMAA